ncbi:MAG: sulfite exporter TauE/SafE family protein [Thermodesulfobacteriaceae bacterium]|nr:sulfite exporter TauE/SafE family protein [Thermodesulfobacteriaceae bacterium]MCX8041170.1 sulfite exporter TauE/SafE family protein [Thermodesulfobacteriaceae bacterium]MDW8135192.1 sulfite exporter TauE/SafE family protein [Thermodesulfobacterium sp.]
MITLPWVLTFKTSGVTTSLLIPPLVSFIISFFCASGGVSGAFLLLPFQVSILKFTAPAVSATNHLYNVFAIPFGVYTYWKEKRFFYPLTLIITIGTFPGVILGYFLRISFFQELAKFKLLVGLVLLVISLRLVQDLFFSKKETSFSPVPPKVLTFNWKVLEFVYSKQNFKVNSFLISLIAFIIGIIGGIYGIGGGALMAPILLAFFHLPPYVFAGATLFGTCLTSVLGVLIFTLGGNGPDWLLGFLFGIGGAAGLYLGAKVQKHMPQKLIKIILTILILFISIRYIYSYFNP